MNKEVVKCCLTCKHYSLFGGCKDKNGKLFLLDPKELPCKFWEKEVKKDEGTVR